MSTTEMARKEKQENSLWKTKQRLFEDSDKPEFSRAKQSKHCKGKSSVPVGKLVKTQKESLKN